MACHNRRQVVALRPRYQKRRFAEYADTRLSTASVRCRADRRRPTIHLIQEDRPLAWAANSPPGSATARPDQLAMSAHFVGPHRRCVPARANWPVLDTLATLADGVLAVLSISAPMLDTLNSPCRDIARCPLYSDHS